MYPIMEHGHCDFKFKKKTHDAVLLFSKMCIVLLFILEYFDLVSLLSSSLLSKDDIQLELFGRCEFIGILSTFLNLPTELLGYFKFMSCFLLFLWPLLPV